LIQIVKLNIASAIHFLFPNHFINHINLKKEFTKCRNCKSCGMANALEILNILLKGIHRRGLDDARNISQIAQLMLPDILKL
jgi:inhibitor of KinA sporulation pathway (predicted exonuclease)